MKQEQQQQQQQQPDGVADGDDAAAAAALAERVAQLARSSAAQLASRQRDGAPSGRSTASVGGSSSESGGVATADGSDASADAADATTEQQPPPPPLEVVEAAAVVPPPESGGGQQQPAEAAAAATAATFPSGWGPRKQQQEEEGRQEDEERQPDWLPVTAMAGFVTLVVAALQWWPVLGDAWWGLTGGGQARETLWQLATAVPDTRVTRALQVDLDAIAYDREWRRVLTACLLHSGVVPALCAADALRDGGFALEALGGGLQALAVLLCAGAGAGAAQLRFPVAGVGLAGAGLVVGVYGGWAATVLLRFRGKGLPLCSDRGLVYIAIAALSAWHQPAVGLPCLAGGALGGALGALLAPALARALFVAMAAPVAAALAALKIALETLKVALGVVGVLLLATWRAGAEAVRLIRGL